MTDKEWSRISYKRGAKRVVCDHPNGNYCTANRGGKCIALYNTRFRGQCPFFRDMTTMSHQELDDYYDFVERLETQD